MNEAQEQDWRERNLFSRQYTPAPVKPAWFDRMVTNIGGLNPFGEPRLRVEWGMDLRVFRNSNPQAIKYPGAWGVGWDRWVLECWRPAGFFGTPEQWEEHRYFNDRETGARIDAYGDYPTRGMYVMCEPLCTSKYEYIPCNMEVIRYIEFNNQAYQTKTLNAYTSLEYYFKLQQDMEREQEEGWQRAHEESEEIKDYCKTHADSINTERTYSLPTLKVAPRNLAEARDLLRGN